MLTHTKRLPRVNSLIFPIVLTLLAVLLSSCATNHPDRFSVPFSYRGGLGAGPTPNSAPITLSEGQEAIAIRRAIRSALTKQHFGVTEEKDTEIMTDIVALSRDQIDEYNTAVGSQFQLTNDRNYGLAYTVSFGIDGAIIDFTIAALLSEAGANNPWRSLSQQRQYDSLYFTGSLAKDIEAVLKQATAEGNPSP